MKRFGLLLLLLVMAAPVKAQQARNGYSGFSFVSPLAVGVGNDSNFIIDRSLPGERLFFLSLPSTVQQFAPNALPKQFDDRTMVIAAPTMAYLSDSIRRQFAVTYQPEFELFFKNSDQNAVNHVASADFTYALNRRIQIGASDVFRQSNDPSRTLQNVFLLLPRGPYTENVLRGYVGYDHSALTSFGARVDHTMTKFRLVDQFQRRGLDTKATGVSFIATRMVKRSHRLRGTYSIFSVKPLNSQDVGDDAVDVDNAGLLRAAHSVNAEYRFSPNTSTVFEITGGGVNTQSGTNFIFGGSADRRFGEMWLGGGYSRSLSFFAGGAQGLANGISPATFYEVVYFRFRGQPSRRTGLQITGIGSRNVDSSVVESSKAALGRARFDYRWTERTVTFITAETYQQNRNDYVAAPVSRNRLIAGIEFSLSSEFDRRTSRLNRDAEYVALTDQGRRRLPQ